MDATVEKVRSKKTTFRPFQEEVFPIIEESATTFYRAIVRYTNFHLTFIALIFVQILGFSLIYPFYKDSLLSPALLSLILFTLFSYLTLRMHMITRKAEQLEQSRDGFILMCQELITSHYDDLEYHTSLSYGLKKFAESLNGNEYKMFRLPKVISRFIDPSLYSGFWYWYDFLKMKELLLQGVVIEHLEMVKKSPLNLDVHASLANAYILLANLYADSKSWLVKGSWKYREARSEWIRLKFREVSTFAIEEYKILLDYTPDDPWVHAQLGYIYRELEMTRQEIHEYEAIVALRPTDLESLFHLGSLYFSAGHNAKGLQIFETLKRLDETRAEELMRYYGSHLYK